jgi:multisubunit Na+/H+ antiporter MnhC subunit/multisubunit Na+/H+ antiporter MnhB subunit
MSLTLNTALALLFLGLAAWTVFARDTFAAVAGFIPYGLLLTLVWLQLSAIDVAMTEAAIGAGLTGALLVGAASRLRRTEPAARADRPGLLTRVLAAVAAVGVAAVIAVCVLALPDPPPTLAPQVAANIASTGVGNPITAVLLSFRAMDTLLEAIVLLFALVGVWSLAPDRAWGGRPGPAQPADPNGILAYFARVLPPIGIVVAIYILWVGADDPGGKFQGATILAAARHDGRAGGCAAREPHLAAHRAGGRACGVHRHRLYRRCPRGRVPRLSRRLRQAADRHRRSGADALSGDDAGPAAGRRAATDVAAMSPTTLFGMCGAVLVGLGLYGLIVNPQPLRKILAFNLIGNGIFVVCAVIARRGAAAGMNGDPVPQALLITAIVVAFAASALAVALLLRLFEEAGSVTLSGDLPPKAKAADGGV